MSRADRTQITPIWRCTRSTGETVGAAQIGGYARCWPGGSTTLGDLLADDNLGLRLAEPPGTVLGSMHRPVTPGLRGVGDGARWRCVRQ